MKSVIRSLPAFMLILIAARCGQPEQEENWQEKSHERAAGTFINGAPLAMAGMVIAGTGAATVLAMDAETGRLLWKTQLAGGYVRAQPVAAPDGASLYVGASDGGVYRLGMSGALSGFCSLGEPVAAMAGVEPASPDQPLLVAVGEKGIHALGEKSLQAVSSLEEAAGLEKPACRTLWSKPFPFKVSGSPAVEKGRVMVAGIEGRIAAFDILTGSPAWNLPKVTLDRVLVEEKTAKGGQAQWKVTLDIGYHAASGETVTVVGALKVNGREAKDLKPTPGFQTPFEIASDGLSESYRFPAPAEKVSACEFELSLAGGATRGALLDRLPCTLSQ